VQTSYEWASLLSFSDGNDYPMTLQIGMIGSDGFAIVGDTWKHMPAQNRRSWFGYSGPKMMLSASGKSLGAIARTVEISFEAVKEVFAQLEGHAGDKVEQISEIGSRIIRDHEAEFFVAFTEPHPEMYFFQKEKEGRARCERMYGCYQIGDAGNPAYYWVMRNCDIDQTVAEMVRVGALTVITGAKVNPAMIRDLDVATFDKKGLRLWEREETRALKAEIEDLDKRIGKALLNRENAL
jgi:hypothetical protein